MDSEARRMEFQTLLEEFVSDVYFQPPASVRMNYPCIVYERSNIRPTFADNSPYSLATSYQVTVIHRDPDSPIPYNLAQLPMCKFNRHFTSDNLHHDVFTIFF